MLDDWSSMTTSDGIRRLPDDFPELSRFGMAVEEWMPKLQWNMVEAQPVLRVHSDKPRNRGGELNVVRSLYARGEDDLLLVIPTTEYFYVR
jgi:hypothetical protein